MAETFYSVLGVDPEADTETIRAAYRELVKTHHPDVSDEDDAASQFKRITQARDILLDETSRKQYDRVGHNTYVRRYMDSNDWSVDYSSNTRQSDSGQRDPSNTGARNSSNHSSTRSHRSGSSNRSRSQSGSRHTSRSSESDTARDYDRYRSHYSADDAHGSGQSSTDWEERSWTEDFDDATDRTQTAAAGATETGAGNRARADGWQTAQTTARGYTPSGRDSTTVSSGTSTGGIQPALRDIGPWLVFHFIFLISAFVTILLLMSWEASVPTVFISLILLGGAVFFSVLHMISRIYS